MLSKRFLRAVVFLATLPVVARGANLFPADGAQNVSPDTPLRISFGTPPTGGPHGTIQVVDTASKAVVATVDLAQASATQSIGGVDKFNYHPVIIAGNDAMIYLPNHALGYGRTYSVSINPGAFAAASEKDSAANATIRGTFTTKKAPPRKHAPKLIVAADGTGDFCTVQGAIDFIPEGNTKSVTILVRKGTYHELISLTNKHAVTLVGEDRKESVITYSNNAKFNPAGTPYRRGVLLANQVNDLTLANLTIRNTTPRGGSQAEAIILSGSTTARAIVTDVDLFSYQDTLQINGQAYVKNCYIEGDVDFMWGTGPCFFENCFCQSLRSGAYYTQVRNTETNHGFVYLHCTFDGADGITGNFLSRIAPTRFPHSEVVLLECVLGSSVNSAGWLVEGPGPTADLHFWEYKSKEPTGGLFEVIQRLPASRQLNEGEDAKTISDYSNAVFVLGSDWNPKKARPEGVRRQESGVRR